MRFIHRTGPPVTVSNRPEPPTHWQPKTRLVGLGRSPVSTAAETVDPNYVVTPVSTYFFTAASSVVLSIVIALVVDLVLAKRPDLAHRPTAEDERATAQAFNISLPGVVGHESLAEESNTAIALTARERRGLKLSALVLVGYILVIAALLYPGSPMRGEGGSIVQSVVLVNISVFIALLFALLGMVYGRQVGTIPSLAAVPGVMVEGITSIAPVIVLFFAVSQFLGYFKWTGIGNVITVEGAELLKSLDAPHLIILLTVVVAISLLNMIITSGSAMWSILAPVIVPMMMYINLAPEAAMVSFMIGDSVTNCVTPMNAYFVLALGFIQRYRKDAGIGTLLSFTVPVAFTVLIAWSLFFVAWYLIGIPLGPGVPVR
jgi:aminobenzoyl-glutamate transport protein